MQSINQNKNNSTTTIWTAEECLEHLEDDQILNPDLEHPSNWDGYFDGSVDNVFPLPSFWEEAVSKKRREIRVSNGVASYDDLTVDQKINLHLKDDSCCHWVAIYKDELALKYHKVAQDVSRMNIFLLDTECSDDQAKKEVLDYLESHGEEFSNQDVEGFLVDAEKWSNDGKVCQVVVR